MALPHRGGNPGSRETREARDLGWLAGLRELAKPKKCAILLHLFHLLSGPRTLGEWSGTPLSFNEAKWPPLNGNGTGLWALPASAQREKWVDLSMENIIARAFVAVKAHILSYTPTPSRKLVPRLDYGLELRLGHPCGGDGVVRKGREATIGR